ncbi:mitochondrial distribution and morphology protein 34-like [Daphnia pulicaria]|uniref:mitochondrial distribution and morphology protein 34-like n=1 Tax=Daphnia pulicaria TaxID=35523 RepID=UPI001EEACF4C|nr:mitochondrial distribution and morphology protein 34-like [Daphnia pulicaria]
MNTFKTVLVICAMLGVSASCSSSYQPAGSQGSQTAEAAGDFHGGVTGGSGQSSSYVSQPVVPNSPAAFSAEQQRPAESAGPLFGAEKVRPVIAAAAAAAATAQTTQYICSCITINPVATVKPHHVPTGDSFAQAAAQQQTFASQQEQQQQQQQQQSSVGPASSQSVPVQQQQSAGDNRGHY